MHCDVKGDIGLIIAVITTALKTVAKPVDVVETLDRRMAREFFEGGTYKEWVYLLGADPEVIYDAYLKYLTGMKYSPESLGMIKNEIKKEKIE
jgi:hypothetical protein